MKGKRIPLVFLILLGSISILSCDRDELEEEQEVIYLVREESQYRHINRYNVFASINAGEKGWHEPPPLKGVYVIIPRSTDAIGIVGSEYYSDKIVLQFYFYGERFFVRAGSVRSNNVNYVDITFELEPSVGSQIENGEKIVIDVVERIRAYFKGQRGGLPVYNVVYSAKTIRNITRKLDIVGD
ncbi:MAG: hypothetical protein OXH39_04935 [Candidatus Poribacteria bacterium]|nr:hypothetical protein [Candidatus Poribacteria bacterium]